MADRVLRIFIDSSYKAVASASNVDFRIDLPFPVEIDAGATLRVESVILSHVWQVVDERNRHLYLREVDSGGTSYHRVLKLDPGNYNIGSLAVELQQKVRLGSRISDGEWAATSADGRLTLPQPSPNLRLDYIRERMC